MSDPGSQSSRVPRVGAGWKRGVSMSARRMLGSMAFAAAVGVLAHIPMARAAHDDCTYKGAMFSEGGQSCQSGALFRCMDGKWKSSGVACTSSETAVAPGRCELYG